jgi:hypothetical protein
VNFNFKLNRKGGSEVLKLQYVPDINALAKRIADQAGDEAVMEEYTTDRAAAIVSVPAAQQAKDGVLTRAASASGLEFRAK